MTYRIKVVLLLIGCAPAPLLADDWPQFGGKDRDGRSHESGLMDAWPAGGPPLEWSVEGVGAGYSSVSVVQDRIYTIGDEGDDQFVFALDRDSGRAIWKTRIGPANHEHFRGSRSTPTVDDGRLYVLGTDGDVVCLDASDGSINWQRNLKAEFHSAMMLAMGKYEWQYSESPLVDGDQVVVTPGTNTAALAALNKQHGSTIWKAELPDLGTQGENGAGYCSMIVAHIHGTRQYVQLLGRGVIGVDTATGEFLWGYNRIANNVANVSTPIVNDNHVFVSTGYQTGAALLDIQHKNNQWNAEEAYFLKSKTFQNHHGGLIHHAGHIYAGHGHKQGLPVCIEMKTGKIVWGPIRTDGEGSASICYADQHVYFRYENGLVMLIEASPDEFREKGSFMLPDVRGKSWSRPVISGGKLYLKEQDLLYCYRIST